MNLTICVVGFLLQKVFFVTIVNTGMGLHYIIIIMKDIIVSCVS